MSDRITLSKVTAAREVLHGIAHTTPIVTSRSLDHESNALVFLKCENFQRTGSFKFRGAYNAVSQLKLQNHRGSVITVSSGNHAQGIALACRLLGYQAQVVMPKPFAEMKYRSVRSYGATVIVAEDRTDAEQLLSNLVDEPSAAFVHPFNDPDVIAGQGTVMMELIEQQPHLDAVLAPVGGGGLLSGLCVTSHALNPRTKIYACEPAGALDAMQSVKENRIVPATVLSTIADGLRTSLGDLTLPILRRHLTGFFVVEEREIATAMSFAFERLKVVIEPSSAVALAPLLRRESSLIGKRIGIVLTGGNVDQDLFCRCLDAATAAEGGTRERREI